MALEPDNTSFSLEIRQYGAHYYMKCAIFSPQIISFLKFFVVKTRKRKTAQIISHFLGMLSGNYYLGA